MQLPKSKNDIVSLTAQEVGVSKETVKFVIKFVEERLRWYFRHPFYAAKRIIIPELGVFLFRWFKLDNFIEVNQQRKRYRKNYEDDLPKLIKLRELYNEEIEQRQAILKDYYAGHSISNGESE